MAGTGFNNEDAKAEELVDALLANVGSGPAKPVLRARPRSAGARRPLSTALSAAKDKSDTSLVLSKLSLVKLGSSASARQNTGRDGPTLNISSRKHAMPKAVSCQNTGRSHAAASAVLDALVSGRPTGSVSSRVGGMSSARAGTKPRALNLYNITHTGSSGSATRRSQTGRGNSLAAAVAGGAAPLFTVDTEPVTNNFGENNQDVSMPKRVLEEFIKEKQEFGTTVEKYEARLFQSMDEVRRLERELAEAREENVSLRNALAAKDKSLQAAHKENRILNAELREIRRSDRTATTYVKEKTRLEAMNGPATRNWAEIASPPPGSSQEEELLYEDSGNIGGEDAAPAEHKVRWAELARQTGGNGGGSTRTGDMKEDDNRIEDLIARAEADMLTTSTADSVPNDVAPSVKVPSLRLSADSEAAPVKPPRPVIEPDGPTSDRDNRDKAHGAGPADAGGPTGMEAMWKRFMDPDSSDSDEETEEERKRRERRERRALAEEEEKKKESFVDLLANMDPEIKKLVDGVPPPMPKRAVFTVASPPAKAETRTQAMGLASPKRSEPIIGRIRPGGPTARLAPKPPPATNESHIEMYEDPSDDEGMLDDFIYNDDSDDGDDINQDDGGEDAALNQLIDELRLEAGEMRGPTAAVRPKSGGRTRGNALPCELKPEVDDKPARPMSAVMGADEAAMLARMEKRSAGDQGPLNIPHSAAIPVMASGYQKRPKSAPSGRYQPTRGGKPNIFDLPQPIGFSTGSDRPVHGVAKHTSAIEDATDTQLAHERPVSISEIGRSLSQVASMRQGDGRAPNAQPHEVSIEDDLAFIDKYAEDLERRLSSAPSPSPAEERHTMGATASPQRTEEEEQAAGWGEYVPEAELWAAGEGDGNVGRDGDSGSRLAEDLVNSQFGSEGIARESMEALTAVAWDAPANDPEDDTSMHGQAPALSNKSGTTGYGVLKKPKVKRRPLSARRSNSLQRMPFQELTNKSGVTDERVFAPAQRKTTSEMVQDLKSLRTMPVGSVGALLQVQK